MNAKIFETLPELREALRCTPKHQIEVFFALLKQDEYKRISELTKDQLTDLQSRVNIIGEMEFLFLQAKEPKQQ